MNNKISDILNAGNASAGSTQIASIKLEAVVVSQLSRKRHYLSMSYLHTCIKAKDEVLCQRVRVPRRFHCGYIFIYFRIKGRRKQMKLC